MGSTCSSLLDGRDGYPAFFLTDVVQLSHRMVDLSPPLGECVMDTFSNRCATELVSEGKLSIQSSSLVCCAWLHNVQICFSYFLSFLEVLCSQI